MATSEGFVTFPSDPSTEYRYLITTDSMSIEIWLKDAYSKHEWKSNMVKPSDLNIRNAQRLNRALAECFACFTDCLEEANGESGDVDLVMGFDGVLMIFFWLNLNASTINRRQAYCIPLNKIVRNDFQVMKSKVHVLEAKVAHLEKRQVRTFIGHFNKSAPHGKRFGRKGSQYDQTYISNRSDRSLQSQRRRFYEATYQAGCNGALHVIQDGNALSFSSSFQRRHADDRVTETWLADAMAPELAFAVTFDAISSDDGNPLGLILFLLTCFMVICTFVCF